MTPLFPFLAAFARIGLLSFGGPAAQIVLMHDTLVKDRGWLSEAEFLRALSFCMLLPGPEAMQLATYAGWRLRGTFGGVVAGALFVLPGALVVGALSFAYLRFGTLPDVQEAFLGVKVAVLVIVAVALCTLGRKTLKGPVEIVLALGAFVALFVFAVPFPVVLSIAAITGAMTLRGDAAKPSKTATIHWSLPVKTAALWGAIWWGPLGAIVLFAPQSVLADVAVFFSWLAVVTFGGAYAVLAYMAQVAVEGHGWLTAAQMVDGLGLAETTPGPLILVTLFVGILAGSAGVGMALAAGAVTLWATFIPCYLWIFTGAPFVEKLGQVPRLQGALTGISAAVVGVIANLSLWFALVVVFQNAQRVQIGILQPWMPDWAGLLPMALVLLGFAMVLMRVLGWGLARSLPSCALAAWALAQVWPA